MSDTEKELARVDAQIETPDGDVYPGELVLREIGPRLVFFMEDGYGNGASVDASKVDDLFRRFNGKGVT